MTLFSKDISNSSCTEVLAAGKGRLPNFLIIGAAKAGTTSLYYYLKEHPQIYMSPVKEPNFFTFDGDGNGSNVQEETWERVRKAAVTDFDDYLSLFAGANGEIAIGEASTYYLHWDTATARIHHHLPDAKLICLLRDPAERAHSAFMMHKRENQERFPCIIDALQDKNVGVRDSWHGYIEPGFYHAHLSRFLQFFRREQVRAYLYDDFNSDSLQIVRDIYRFLEVDDGVVPNTSARYNVSGIPKNRFLHSLMRPYASWQRVESRLPGRLRSKILTKATALKSKNLTRSGLMPEERQILIDLYREDILRLQELIERDLGRWLQ